jgi:hypothetical protein
MYYSAVARWLTCRIARGTAVLAALSLSTETVAAQHPNPAVHDHRAFNCAEGDLAAGRPVGCQLLTRPEFRGPPEGPVYWHLATVPTASRRAR